MGNYDYFYQLQNVKILSSFKKYDHSYGHFNACLDLIREWILLCQITRRFFFVFFNYIA